MEGVNVSAPPVPMQSFTNPLLIPVCFLIFIGALDYSRQRIVTESKISCNVHHILSPSTLIKCEESFFFFYGEMS